MDGLSIFDVMIIYIVLFVPLLTMVLLIIWTFLNRKNISKFKSLTVVLMFALQILYYLLAFLVLKLESNLAIALLTIIPIFSLVLLYSRVFGHMRKAAGRILMSIIYLAQLILAIATFLLALSAHF